jgi:subtilisin family serine protease
MSRTTRILLVAFCSWFTAGQAGAARPDSDVPRKVGGGLRQMLVAAERTGPKLEMELKSHIRNRQGEPLVFLRLASGVTAEQALPTLRAAGFKLQRVSSLNSSLMEGYVPLSRIKELAQTPGLVSVRAVRRPFRKEGLVQSEAVQRQHVDSVLARGITGKGIRVGVMSDSYDACGANCFTIAADDIASGDLPAEGVKVFRDLQPGDQEFENATDEGRGMLQLVHDLAPDAKLGFYTAFIGELEFAEGMLALRNEFHADVVVDDVGYSDEPMYSDGILAQAVDVIKRSGGAYFSSAGNNGNEAYEAVYSPISFAQAQRLVAQGKSNVKLDQIPAEIRPTTVHRFSNLDGSSGITQRITTAGGRNDVEFQWDEPFYLGKVQTDYNLYIFDKDGNWMDPFSADFPGFYTIDANTDTDAPEEYLILLPFAGEVHGGIAASDYQIVIGKVGNGPARHIKYITINGLEESERDGAPSTWGHPAARGAQGVAAIYYGDSTPEGFTSPGPVTIYLDKDGNRLAHPEVRFTPQLTAVDGANTTFFGFDAEGDGFPNFFGTSAAAPDVAGVAALMLQAAGGPGSLSPDRIYQKLQSTASPIALPLNRTWSAAFAGPVTFLADGDWTRWNRFFNLEVSQFVPRNVRSIEFDATDTNLLWSLNPARFHTADLKGISASEMTVATSPDQHLFTINFAPGSFGRGDSVQFGMSLFTDGWGTTQVLPDQLRNMKITVTLENGQRYSSRVVAGFKFPVNNYSGFGLVNADAAVNAVTH